MRRALAILVCLPLALVGCGSTRVDSGKAQAFLISDVKPRPRSVTCPSGVTVKAGRSFDCSLVAADGRRYTVTLHIADASGHVRQPSAADLHPVEPSSRPLRRTPAAPKK